MMSLSNYLASRFTSSNSFSVARPILISSILGRFIRKCKLEYINMDFDAAGLLWDLFKALKTGNSKLGETDISIENMGIPFHDHTDGPLSKSPMGTHS